MILNENAGHSIIVVHYTDIGHCTGAAIRVLYMYRIIIQSIQLIILTDHIYAQNISKAEESEHIIPSYKTTVFVG